MISLTDDKKRFILSCLLVLFTSCSSERDFGFPKYLTIPGKGGEVIVSGKTAFFNAAIMDYNGNNNSLEGLSEDGIETVVFDWLRAEYKKLGTDTIKLIASPNNTGKNRNLYLELYSGQKYCVIKVWQNK